MFVERLTGENPILTSVWPTVSCHHGTDREATASVRVRGPAASANQFTSFSLRFFTFKILPLKLSPRYRHVVDCSRSVDLQLYACEVDVDV